MTRSPRPADESTDRAPTTEDPFRGPDPFLEFEPAYRTLRVYAFDPGLGRRGGNHLLLRVPFEPVKPGPIGSRIHVIDQDETGTRLNPPLDLDHPDVPRNGGLEPNDANPQFHQQMVYAVIAHLLRTFDRALGRQVRFRTADAVTPVALTVFPHGLADANAYYNNATCALSLGHFRAQRSVGRIIKGQSIYTCLSHSVTVHEATHALLDCLRPEYYNAVAAEDTGDDTAAFSEGFCDLIAMLHQSTFQQTLLDPIERTGGRLYSVSLQPELDGLPGGTREERNPLIGLGQQFAEAIGIGSTIRSAVSTEAGSEHVTPGQPHRNGELMTRAIFDAFFHVYARRTRGLLRLSAMPRGHEDHLHPDLVRRLAAEASQLASAFLRLCIRAIVYCPAGHVALGDYLRALVTIHARLDPADRDGFRDALIDGFARRSLYPPGVASMSEASLLWRPPERDASLSRDVVRALRAADAAGVRDAEAEAQLRIFCETHRDLLGFDNGDIEIIPFHQAIRFVGPELDIAEELVCQVKQARKTSGKGRGQPSLNTATLIFGDDGREGRLRYAITRSGSPSRRTPA
jgi:hypothetical protein